MNLGESYLAARGITPETIQAHNIEIDAPPSEERILERLRKDILLDGVPLSKFAEAQRRHQGKRRPLHLWPEGFQLHQAFGASVEDPQHIDRDAAAAAWTRNHVVS